MTVTDDIANDDNKQLKQLLTQGKCTKMDLQRAQTKKEMGLERRAELEEDQKVLKKKFKEIRKK